MAHTESALVVKVPAAEQVVGPWRSLYDPAATWGVPAHVTVLYPFVHPDQIHEELTQRVGQVIAEFYAFDAEFNTVDQFGRDVLILRPAQSESFSAMTAAIVAEWPECQPYHGVHDEVIPHLTVAHTGQGASFDALSARIRSELPIRTRVDVVDLMVGSYEPGSWHTVATFDLG